MKLRLEQRPPKSLHPVSVRESEMLAEALDWEVLGVVTFIGRVALLVFVERKYFWQIEVEVFESSDVEIPSHWRMATRVGDRLRGVSFLLGHPFLVSDPNLVGYLIDGDENAIAKFRAALERDEIRQGAHV